MWVWGAAPELSVRAVTATSEPPLQPLHEHSFHVSCTQMPYYFILYFYKLLIIIIIILSLIINFETRTLTEPGAHQCDYTSLWVSSRVLLPLPPTSEDSGPHV